MYINTDLRMQKSGLPWAEYVYQWRIANFVEIESLFRIVEENEKEITTTNI
jgi:hypothetical protein